MLEARDLRVTYGAAPAVDGVSLDVKAGALVVVVGPNGAGKTTLINALSGVHRVQSGRLTIDGRSLTDVAPHRFCDHGIALVPEGRRLFTGLTVRENLELGAYRSGARGRRAESLHEVCTLFPVLQGKLAAPAGTLSGGQQQMVAIARALMARPRLLLLDEPSLGLAPIVIDEVFDALARIGAQGVSILLVEQDVERALGLATRAYLLVEGRVAAEGASAELSQSDAVRAAVLGT